MESPALDDDICILKHETAYVSPESPVSACAGDESVASHFALVTAYEDIKKRLRDTEKENGLLRRRVKQLEDKVLLSSFVSNLQPVITRVKNREISTVVFLLSVMKSLTDTADYWQVDKRSSEMKIHSLQEQLDRLQIENDALHKLCRAGQDVSENCVVDDDQSLEALTDFRTMAIVQSYRDVLSEVSHLQSVVQSQSELVKKMRERPAPPVFRRAASTVPVQCLDDVQKSSVPRPPSAPPLPGVRLNPTLRMSSLDDSSWSFPSTPRPSDALFWDQTKPKSPAGDWAQPH
uniref:5-azacytidine-induced protein 2-like n=1 Tax=Sinocyclocheilus anshuiensis TaxID=1608454 RepID=A0A671KGU0_9TELE